LFKKILLICAAILLIVNCKDNLIYDKVDKIIIENRDHEYIGKELDRVEISDDDKIEDIIEKLNDYEEYIAKFAGKYYMKIEYANGELLTLRTNGINFEILQGLKNSKMRYFKIKKMINLEDYF
jgi:hypothetical protein